ncbi:IS66 family insertion sequence element accessory protein TnpB [Turicibacter sanguinis]|uniref:IS66 family insertion sequence element accessory protein TnpB n=1 Tax=Turicibacter sanguinis TaxID=154288 RepID=UPI0018AC4556|nr:IS66 family insertion sequence element accessory protein TnpB [Turicibacter sanguinis]MDB8559589.1 IS66 family insertion sequence element accessory protein TnpB [Turicibacter sanguinis]MDB8561042.1 IS66 family insertion sequence element accessory protein TnpB [Turicibacter sanguinis]
MLVNFSEAKHIFVVCGRTDMRFGMDRLITLIADKYELNLFDDALFLFCGTKKDRFKALYWDQDGFLMIYKRIENGKLQWPKNLEEVKKINQKQLRWLLEGLSVSQPKAIKTAEVGSII